MRVGEYLGDFTDCIRLDGRLVPSILMDGSRSSSLMSLSLFCPYFGLTWAELNLLKGFLIRQASGVEGNKFLCLLLRIRYQNGLR